MVYKEMEINEDLSQMDVPTDNAVLQKDQCELPTLGLKSGERETRVHLELRTSLTCQLTSR